jgi:hypothetical protein
MRDERSEAGTDSEKLVITTIGKSKFGRLIRSGEGMREDGTGFTIGTITGERITANCELPEVGIYDNRSNVGHVDEEGGERKEN